MAAKLSFALRLTEDEMERLNRVAAHEAWRRGRPVTRTEFLRDYIEEEARRRLQPA